MNLSKAKHLAESIVGALQPHCMRIEIAGSIRRQCERVNDIDLVVIPKDGLLQPIVDRVTVKWKQIAGVKGDARNLRFVSPNDFQLDIFIAHDDVEDLVQITPSNWGAVLLCRTGSLQHNTQLCTHAHSRGLKFAPYRGIVDRADRIVGSRTEEEIYGALGLTWRAPRERQLLKI